MLFLIGYMGSGKSTIANALGALKGLNYVDLDY
jgi:shikimate kinase